MYQAVRLELLGRDGAFQALEMDDDVPNLLGQAPVEELDLLVDPNRRRLIPNPEHGGVQMAEDY